MRKSSARFFAAIMIAATLTTAMPATQASALAKSYKNTFLGGQNDIKVQMEAAEDISAVNRTVYDYTCYECFSSCMREYIYGYYSFDDALEMFYDRVKDTYPKLKINK